MLRLSKAPSLAATILAGIAAIITLSTGCGEGVVDDDADTVYFAPLERDELRTERIAAPEGPSDEQVAQVKPIIDGFSENAGALFARGDIESRLPQIEQVFVSTGHYLDLVAIYQNVVDTQGISSRATALLVRHYLRLGQRHLARDLLDEMIAERPDDPQTWFLNGTFWLPKLEGSEEAGARVIASWQKVLDLDANFEGFEQANLPPLREQLEALRQRVPQAAVRKAVAELDEEGAAAEETGPDEKPRELEAAEQQEAPRETADAELPEADAELPAHRDPSDADGEPAPEAQPAPEESKEAEPVAITLARADMALGQGDAGGAKELFEEVLEREPTNVDATVGIVRSGWQDDESSRNQLATTLRELAERDDLTPRQQYDIGQFAFTKMQDPKLAAKLWKEAKERDPKLADRVGLDRLIERASR